MRAFVMLCVLVLVALANPLGFKLDKTTYYDITTKFRVDSSVKNLDTGGTSVYVDKNNFNLDGLVGNSVRFDFNAQDKLTSLSLSFRKNKFNELFSSLSKQYTLIDRTKKGGETFVKFEDDDSIITLDKLNQRTLLTYTSKNELKRQQKELQKERKRKKRNRDYLKKML